MKERQQIPYEAARYFLPRTEGELLADCLNRRQVSALMQLVPGLGLRNKTTNSVESIMGTYGLVQLDSVTRRPVVFSGFSIIDNKVLEITHPPQGKKPGLLGDGERRRLRSREFRIAMISWMVDLARQLSLKQVRSIYSGDHHSLRLGSLEDYEAYQKLDKPFDRFPLQPFQFMEVSSDDHQLKGYWVLNL